MGGSPDFWFEAGLDATPGCSDSKLMMPAVTAARTSGMDSIPPGTLASRSHQLAVWLPDLF